MRVTVNNTEYAMRFRHGTASSTKIVSLPNRVKDTVAIEVPSTTFELLVGPVGSPDKEKEVFSATVKKHSGDKENLAYARWIATQKVLSGFPREIRKAVLNTMNLRVPTK